MTTITTEKPLPAPAAPRLYATPETMERLEAHGLSQTILDLSGRDTIVVRQSDVVALLSSGRRINDLQPAELLDRAGHEHAQNIEKQGLLQQSLVYTLMNRPAAARLSDNLCLIVVPDTENAYFGNMSPVLDAQHGIQRKISEKIPGTVGRDHYYLMDLSGGVLFALTPEPSEPLPGGIIDWKRIISAHEAAHCSDFNQSFSDTLAGEIDADHQAINHILQNPEYDSETATLLAQTLIDVRAMGSLAASTTRDTHITNVALNPDGTLNINPEDSETIAQDWNDMRQKIDDRFHGMTNGLTSDNISDLETLKNHNMIRHLAIKHLYEEGAFADSPIQQRFAEQYLDATARYASPDLESTQKKLLETLMAHDQNITVVRPNPPESAPSPSDEPLRPQAGPAPGIS